MWRIVSENCPDSPRFTVFIYLELKIDRKDTLHEAIKEKNMQGYLIAKVIIRKLLIAKSHFLLFLKYNKLITSAKLDPESTYLLTETAICL